MNSLSISSYKLTNTSILSRSMVLSLTCSLLAHLTAFACSYNCNILPKEKNNPPFMVELIDLPIKTEMEQMVNQEDSGRKDVVKAGMNGKGGKCKISNRSTYLSTKSNLPLIPQGEMKDSNTSTFEAEATVSLDSQELKYVSYLSKIKKKIEPKWVLSRNSSRNRAAGQISPMLFHYKGWSPGQARITQLFRTSSPG